MEDRRVADYFVVAGLPEDPQILEEFSNETALKPDHKQDPIVDVCVIVKSLGEAVPSNYKCIEFTPTGFPADLNHGSIRAPEVYLCFRRGRDKPPIMDIGVLYEGKERVKDGCEVITTTPFGRSGNVNNSTSRTYVTYRRADETASCDTLAVMDICVILANKGEVPPHAFNQIAKNLNKGMMGSDVFLCYKKSMAKDKTIAYHPGILSRYPREDNPSFPLPEQVPMFCLPLGATVECWTAKARKPEPVFSTFVLTGGSGEKVYGAALMLYEEFPQEKLTDEQLKLLSLKDDDEYSEAKTVQVTKCICLLARWPFFEPFKKYLKYLYRIVSPADHSVPLERHISHFMTEVPYPSPQRPRILVQLVNDVIPLSQREETPLPQNGASFIKLLKNLGPDNCLNLLLYALLEHKILIHSLRPDVLTSVAEALASIIFPFHWECPYIPLCPLGLSDVLNAPCPFIVGVDSRYFDLYDPPSDVTCVDLDTNTITQSEDKKGVHYKMLPKKATKTLKSTLEKLFDRLCQEPSEPGTPEETGLDLAAIDHDFSKRRKELLMEVTIQEAFLRYTATILKGYHTYLLPITQAPTIGTTDVSSLFDVSAFLKSRDKAYHKFFAQLMRTQLFSRFIEVRSFASDKDACLAFFDECCDKVDDYNTDLRLIELDESVSSERTVFIYPPEASGLPPDVTYSYDGRFPELKPELFLPEKTPSLITPIKQPICPNSPMTKRTKQEIKSAQKIAQRHAESPSSWAKCLMAHCYSLWFIHLPAYVKSVHSKTKALRTAYDVLVRMQNAKLQIPDEVCYRVLMQLCGLYHQPVLAVKVLFELKRNGVQPNAITYGFYNKVVLESKWPSSDTNAYMLWTKLRNVIMAMAQFKQGLRRRRLSMYSTSESDFDRISRTSTDSYVDENKTEFVQDLVSVGSPNIEERTSTGGMSDRGYSSMTLDDGTGKRSSMVIGSQESLDSLGKMANFKREGKETDRPRMIAKMGNHKKELNFGKDKHLPKDEEEEELAFHPIDPQLDALLRQKVGSIVKKSGGSLGSGSTLRGGSTLGSSAGLLMTSQTSLDESLFGEFGLSHSLNFQTQNNDIRRKRHKSSGDHLHRRAKSLQEDSQVSNISGAADLGLSLTRPKSDSEPAQPNRPEGSIIVTGVMNYGNASPLVNGNVEQSLDDSCEADRTACDEADISGIEPLPTVDILDLDSLENNSFQGQQNGSQTMENGIISEDLLLLKKALDPLGVSSSTDVSEGKAKLEPVSGTGSGSQGTPKLLLSPTHSIRTPVTENDPLGLFCSPPVPLSISQCNTTASSGIDLLTMSPEKKLICKDITLDMSQDSGVSSTTSRSANRTNLLIDIEPFSNTSTPVKKQNNAGGGDSSQATPTRVSVGSAGGDAENAVRTSNSSRVASISSSSASSPGSPAEAWAPISQSQVESPEPATPSKSATLPPETTTRGSHHHSSKRGKQVSRSESFRSALSSMAGFASKAFNTKFSDLKQTMASPSPSQPPNATSTETPTTLPKPHEMEKLLYEEEEDMLRKAASLQRSSKDNLSRGSSVDNITETDGKSRNTSKYMPNMSGILGGLMSLPQSLPSLQTMQGLAYSSLDSLKGAANSYMSPGDHHHQVQEMDGQLRPPLPQPPPLSGSTQSIPQALFNMAMEVDMCSLSKCTSCSSLLYDEEIMAGWSADDSNLNTSCQFCGQKLVPLLHIVVKDFRQGSRPLVMTPSQSSESMQSVQSMPNVQMYNSLAVPDHKGALTNRSNVSLPNADSLSVGEGKPTPSPTLLVNPVITEVANESDSITNANGESSTEVKEGKLISFSPTHEPLKSAHGDLNERTCEPIMETKELILEPKEVPSVDRQRSQSECNTASTDGAGVSIPSPVVEKIKELDSVSQISVATDDGEKQDDRKRSIVLEPITIPYLSPLVLRKEVENVVEQEGDMCLSKAEFVDEHPIIFWNMIWYFKRLDVPSHLPGFTLTAKTTNRDLPPPKLWSTADSRHVMVRPVWDNLRMHEDHGVPMYTIWGNSANQSSTVNALLTESQAFPRSLMQQIVSNIMTNNVVTPLKDIMNERRKLKRQTGRGRYNSMYRDILFLAFVALGRDNIDTDAFDREYRVAFNQLNPKEMAQIYPYDRPPKRLVVSCRQRFGEVELNA